MKTLLLALLFSGQAAAAITEAQFNAVIDRLESLYSPDIAALGDRLVILRNWNRETVNLFASYEATHHNRVVILSGGYARLPLMDEDTFALSACHELGHHLGGFPRKSSWSSAEAQADYFSSSRCMPRYLAGQDNALALRGRDIPVALRRACARAYRVQAERDVCLRTGLAAKVFADIYVADLLAQGEEHSQSRFETPERTRVEFTNVGYASPQCTLDTLFHGALGAPRPSCWFRPSAD